MFPAGYPTYFWSTYSALAVEALPFARSMTCRVLALTTSGPEVTVGPPWLAITLIRKPFDLADVVRLVEREFAWRTG
jgi:hypothetical protein